MIPSKVNEIELVYRNTAKVELKITRSNVAADIARNTYDPDKIGFVETAKTILLNQGNLVLGVVTLSEGGTRGTIFDLKVLLAAALKANAQAIIMVHNHPSGNLTPSQVDKDLTAKVIKGCDILDLKMLDHIILDPWGGHFSFADEGLI